jgi:hypothetical protein
MKNKNVLLESDFNLLYKKKNPSENGFDVKNGKRKKRFVIGKGK